MMSTKIRSLGNIPNVLWAVLLFFATSVSFVQELVAQERMKGWHNSLTQAQEVAGKTGRPIFVVFRCVR